MQSNGEEAPMNESYEPLITKNNSTAWAIKPAPKPAIFPPSGRQPSIQPYKGAGGVKEDKKKKSSPREAGTVMLQSTLRTR